jgi:predicted nucleotidyltransferase
MDEKMNRATVISNIKAVAYKTLPKGSSLILYGSRARGDNRPDSDWDLLILLDKPSLTFSDYNYGYPFSELGWETGEEINAQVYSKQEWNNYSFTPFYKNVERDKILLV